MLGNRDRVRFRRGAGARGNESTGLHNAIQRAAIDYQIFQERERSYAKRLDCDRRAVVETFSCKARTPPPDDRVRAASPLIVSEHVPQIPSRQSESNAIGSFPSLDQVLIENVEHFEKRRVRRNVAHFVIDEFAWRLSVFLPPDFEFEIHIFTSS